ncbi:MAG: hypothetical protein RLZZ505_1259 [Verrucomicrobiota bacterium]|jgi:hypothetical protein
MAYPTEKSKRLADLVKQGENSRLVLSDAHARLRHTLDVPSRIKSSITGAPAKWLGGSLVAGLAASLLFRSGKKKTPAQIVTVKKERGFLLGLLALAFTLVKPAAKIYATKLLKDYLSRRFMDGAAARPHN